MASGSQYNGVNHACYISAFIGLLSLFALGVCRESSASASTAHKAAPQKVDFNHDIRPILAENCFACHGPDETKRKARLRLDLYDIAVHPARSGAVPIVPGSADKSEVLKRTTSQDEDERMPPIKTGKKLTPEQVEMLRRWIDQGAEYKTHRFFMAPQQPELPTVNDKAWPRNPIDYFVLARLEQEGLEPAAEASKRALIRRVKLDLIGLARTAKEVEEFLSDHSPNAYERLVDRFSASRHYGERMAVDWLDAARFADTHGYHIDSGRDMTHWRDWVINAFNTNKPFDQFTVEQLAGDLLPNATIAQKIASGFNRNHMINFEGGAIPEEYHTAYIVDRVNTTATVWLGLSIACAQCHDHKYDPITQRDYYRLFAFFYNVPESGLDGSKGNAAPILRMPSAEQQKRLDELTKSIGELDAKLKALGPKPDDPKAKPIKDELAQRRKEQADLDKQIPSSMVMQEMAKPRDTFVLTRGAYDKKGEKVTAGIPTFLASHREPDHGDKPRGSPSRLDLAKWLVSTENPLTTRVIANRYWQMFFGTGLVKTAEDFGTQGEFPSHPELLDWLAVQFRESGWDVKALVKMIVMSATYRQSSAVLAEHLAKDPDNRLLARAPRLRLPAEFIRDQALAVSGLMNGDIGGKSVFPYQPPGLWEELMSRADGANWTAQTYTPSKGRDLYRRTMYTFWKRTCPPPTLATFDAPDRETCTVRRARTNTPLQALVLLNDPTYVEASRKLAERIMTEAGPSPDERIALGFRLVTARQPTPRELTILRGVFDRQLAA